MVVPAPAVSEEARLAMSFCFRMPSERLRSQARRHVGKILFLDRPESLFVEKLDGFQVSICRSTHIRLAIR